MAPTMDWTAVMTADPEEIQERGDDAEISTWCRHLSEADASEVSDVEVLRKGFHMCQSMLAAKLLELDVHNEKKEETTKDFFAKERRMKEEIDDLRSEVARLKRYSTDTQSGPIDHSRILRQELDSSERELKLLKKELEDKEKQAERERRKADSYQQRVQDLERDMLQLEDLRRDNDMLRSDINNYEQKLIAITEDRSSRQHDDLSSRRLMQDKNKELLSLNDEIIRLTQHNQEMQQELDSMKIKMDAETHDMVKITDDYQKLTRVLQQTDGVVDQLKQDNNKLKMQIQDMQNEVKSKTDAEDEIMIAVNKKVEDWKRAIDKKDTELLDCRQQILDYKQQLVAISMDSERVNVAALAKAVEERDSVINELRSKLNAANADLNQANALLEDRHSQFTKDMTGTSVKQLQVQKIQELQGTIRESDNQVRRFQEQLAKSEQDCREKEKQMSELLERMRQYEAGQYGLSDAVAEIKEAKLQVQIRDRQIVELTQTINGLGNQVNDLMDENEDMRERLGHNPHDQIDLSNFRRNKHARKEEEKALNQVLQKEVENLEEERLELKSQIRKLAQQMGQRAVALGLTAEDMIAVGEFTENLKKKTSYDVMKIKADAESDELKARALQLEGESYKYMKDMERVRQTNAELNIKNRDLEAENQKLEQGLREVLQSFKDKATESGQTIHIESPTLERMLVAIEAKQLAGKYDAALQLKAQVDQLTGRNEELRAELREARVEGNRAKLELDRANNKLAKYEEDMKVFRDAGGTGMMFQNLILPEGMAISSADVIASLNEHLVQVLHELSQKEKLLVRLEEGLEDYKRKFAVVRHQHGLLYNQYSQDKKEWQEQVATATNKAQDLEALLAEDKVKVQEFNRLLETLAQDEPEARRRLAEMARKVTVLRVNEKALTRRYNMAQEVEGQLRKENTKLKYEITAMETAITERLGYLQRYKDMASFKIASLQKSREESVPVSDLESANKQFQELTEKYRDLLDRSNNLIANNEYSATLELELKRLQFERDGLAKELELEKEKTHVYEASHDKLKKQGLSLGASTSADHESLTMAKKLATLEMKEINERQRAEHAMRMYEQRRDMISELELRNSELEQKFAEVTRMNLDAQRVEANLRDELANSVLKSVSDLDRKRMAELEASEHALKIENSRLKEIADVAINQASSFELQKVSQDKELQSLRQQLIDIQSQSDEKKIIGKLHRHIVLLQVSEGTALKKLENSQKKVSKLQVQLLRLEQRLDDKEQALLHQKAESANKSRHLRRTIHELRRMFSGSVPLSKQERFAKAMLKLQEDKDNFAKQLKQVVDERVQVEDRLAELGLQHTALQEVIATLKDGKGAVKVMEWHSKMEALRLDELKKTRQIQRITEQVSYMEKMVRQHEVTISDLEEENVKLTRQYEERQLLWEQREMEMERIINKMDLQQQQIAGAASRFEEATGRFPDITLPVSEQLEQAINTIKSNVKVILETQAESNHIKKRNEELEFKVKEMDAHLLSRDRVIAELRLRLPATAERDLAITKATAGAQYQEEQYETKQALRVAQSTISSLQARLQQKEETITKLESFLKQSRDEMVDLCNKHEADMQLMMEKLHVKSDDAFLRLKSSAVENVKMGVSGLPTNKQLARLNELEDTVIQQDNQIGALSERIQYFRAEVAKERRNVEITSEQLGKDKAQLIEEHHQLVQKLDKENDGLREQISEYKQKIAQLETELRIQKEANEKAPTLTMKSLVEKLKQQLETKETELQRMGRALEELRADLVEQAEMQVKQNSKESAQDWNVQKLLDKKTKDLQDKIAELEAIVERNKGDGRKRREQENQLQVECEELKDEITKKDMIISRLKDSKVRLEQDVDSLERKVERLTSVKKQTTAAGPQFENEELRNQVKYLEQQLAASREALNKAEKPSEDIIRQQAPKISSAIEKWEEVKKYQMQVEKLKAKLAATEAECEKLKSTNEMLRNTVERTTKAKEALEKKTYKNAPPVSLGKSAHLGEQELRERNLQLEEELSELRRSLALSRDAAFEEVQMRNKQLTEKLEQLEKYIQQRQQNQNNQNNSQVGNPELYADLVTREHKLQVDVIKLSEENLSLRFEVAQLQKDMPRLKEQIESKNQYIEALKAESGHTARSVGSWVSGETPTSALRKIGDSGRSTKDLEKTISLLKKVVERTQAENEALKKAPGVVSNEQLTVLEMENDGLREQLEELRSKFGASLGERYESKTKATQRIMTDYERLRKDLRKETETNEKLRVQLNSARLTQEEQAKVLEELKLKLGLADSKRSMDAKGWKAAVASRMAEEKLVKLEAELDNKNKMVADLKSLLKDAAARESGLIAQKEELEKKVAILERFPAGSQLTDSEVMMRYQQSKLTIQKLENEKKQLLKDISQLQGRSHGDVSQADSSRIQMLEEEKNQLQAENTKMKKELANFGPEFFEEIEDLKYNYRESEIRNAQLEEKLKALCIRFGVSL